MSFLVKGPKGNIKKRISFTPKNVNGLIYFNLGFGDWNEEKNSIDDVAISNNGDKDKILATVAAAVLKFTNKFPFALVYAKGSTPARTRLYQMGIVANLNEISQLMYVYGYTKTNTWEMFKKNVNYQAFMAFRKKVVNS